MITSNYKTDFTSITGTGFFTTNNPTRINDVYINNTGADIIISTPVAFTFKPNEPVFYNGTTFVSTATGGAFLNKAGFAGNKVLVATSTTSTDGNLAESTVTLAQLQGFNTRITAIETAQPTFDDVVVVATLPTTGETGKQYIVTTGANKGQSFYWDGSAYFAADQDVVIFTNFAAFPITGEENKIYVDKADKKSYFWDGSTYMQLAVVPAISNALSSTSNTLTSTVNGSVATASIVNSVVLTNPTNDDIIVTINGIPSNTLDLTPAIKTSTVGQDVIQLGFGLGASVVGQDMDTLERFNADAPKRIISGTALIRGVFPATATLCSVQVLGTTTDIATITIPANQTAGILPVTIVTANRDIVTDTALVLTTSQYVPAGAIAIGLTHKSL